MTSGSTFPEVRGFRPAAGTGCHRQVARTEGRPSGRPTVASCARRRQRLGLLGDGTRSPSSLWSQPETPYSVRNAHRGTSHTSLVPSLAVRYARWARAARQRDRPGPATRRRSAGMLDVAEVVDDAVPRWPPDLALAGRHRAAWHGNSGGHFYVRERLPGFGATHGPLAFGKSRPCRGASGPATASTSTGCGTAAGSPRSEARTSSRPSSRGM